MKRIITVCIALCSLVMGLLTVSTVTAPVTAPVVAAEGSPICRIVTEHRKREFAHITHFGDLYGSQCRRPQAGRDIYWYKPKSWAAGYNYDNNKGDPYKCGLDGRFIGTTYRLYIWNNDTGYNQFRKMYLRCHYDTQNAGIKGLTDLPRCYIPWIEEGGRAPDLGYRSYCKFRITYQEHLRWMDDRFGNVGSGYIRSW